MYKCLLGQMSHEWNSCCRVNIISFQHYWVRSNYLPKKLTLLIYPSIVNENSSCFIISSTLGLTFNIFASQNSVKYYFIISKVEYFFIFLLISWFPVKCLSRRLLIFLLSCFFLETCTSILELAYLESCLRNSSLITAFRLFF